MKNQGNIKLIYLFFSTLLINKLAKMKYLKRMGIMNKCI